MKIYKKPIIIVSKCLTGVSCRYNGEPCKSKFLTKLTPYVQLIEVCPETDIGLKTPRNPIRLVQENDSVRLIDPKDLVDYTEKMLQFTQKSYTELKKINPQGFIFKTKSPSCGISDANIYSSLEKTAQKVKRSAGLYSNFMKKNFPLIPIEDEGRLNNFGIRDNFLTKIFILSNFENVKLKFTLGALLDFHTENKLLFMGYNQTITRTLGQLVASHKRESLEKIFKSYEVNLLKLISKPIKYTSMINVFIHAYSYFSKFLRADEKNFFFFLIDNYREGKCPQCVLINLLKGYSYRFSNTYLLNQTLLSPYPEELLDFSDSGKGIIRD